LSFRGMLFRGTPLPFGVAVRYVRAVIEFEGRLSILDPFLSISGLQTRSGF